MIVQNYNSVLTLAHLYQLSDAILVHENDTVHRICGQLLNIRHISFKDVNRVIAQQLGGVLQPALTTDSYGVYSRNPLGERGHDLNTYSHYLIIKSPVGRPREKGHINGSYLLVPDGNI